MVDNVTAQLALLAFALTVAVGLWVGNAPTTVLTRALVAMAVAGVVGKLAGWSVKLVLRDHLQRRKIAIDRAHLAAVEQAEGDSGQAAERVPPTVGTEPPATADRVE